MIKSLFIILLFKACLSKVNIRRDILSVSIHENGELGLTLDRNLYITGFGKTLRGNPYPLESLGILKIHDKLIGVNEESVEGIEYRNVVKLISKRPCKLIFQRLGYDNNGEAINHVLPRKETHIDILDGVKKVIFTADLNHMDRSGKPLCYRYDFTVIDNITQCREYDNIDSKAVESKMVFMLYDNCSKDVLRIISILEEKLAVGVLLVTKSDQLYKESFKKSLLKNKIRIPIGKIHYSEFIEINDYLKSIQNTTEDREYYKTHPLRLRYMSLECLPYENLLHTKSTDEILSIEYEHSFTYMENGVFKIIHENSSDDDNNNNSYENEFVSVLPKTLLSLMPIKVIFPDIDAVCRRFPYNNVNEKNNFVLIDVNNLKCEIERIIQGIEYNNDMGILINGFNYDSIDYYLRLKFLKTNKKIVLISPSAFEYIRRKILLNNEVTVEFKSQSNKEWRKMQSYISQEKWSKELNEQEEQLNELIRTYRGELKKDFLTNLYNIKIKKPVEEL